MLRRMDHALDLPNVLFPLDQAMALVRQDRWLLGAVRASRLKVLADSKPDHHRPYRRTRRLTHLARRSLLERRPVTVSAVSEMAEDGRGDWEMDWPALLYAPIGLPRCRPTGLLIVGTREPYWYPTHEIEYVAAIAVTLTGFVLTLGGPLHRLSGRELETARLVSRGLSLGEVSAALEVDLDEARTLIGEVLRKLAVRSPSELSDAWPPLEPLTDAAQA
jgi:DNA-binding CsgD family transcriptional regulator